MSTGERRIKEFLEKNNIEYKTEYKFDDCVFKKKLSFDFAVFKDNNLFCLIEFDGKQHFKAISYFGGENALHHNMFKDEIKNEYCESKGINLLRIPYWNYENIDEILTKYILNNASIPSPFIMTNLGYYATDIVNKEDQIYFVDFFTYYKSNNILDDYYHGKLEDLLDTYDEYVNEVIEGSIEEEILQGEIQWEEYIMNW